VRDAEVLHRLAPLVAMPREALDARYRFRPDQALHIIGVRTFALARAAEVVFRDEYAGCRSWLSVDEEIDVERSIPVLSAADLQARLATVDSLLAIAV